MIGDQRGPIQGLGDVACCGVPRPAVGRLEHEAELASLLTCQARIGRNDASVERPPEALHLLEPVERVEIERHQSDERDAGRRIVEDKELGIGSAVAMAQMTTIGGGDCLAAIKCGRVASCRQLRRAGDDRNHGAV